jgi:glycosyltransferase involved in cell wall biosynthesis
MCQAKPEQMPGSDSVKRSLRVAVIIPVLNEASTLGMTLSALFAQEYPRELIKILVVDGGSDDDWEAVIESAEAKGLPVRVLRNRSRTTAAAVNLALRSTEADAILWISGHCILSPDYIRKTAAAFSEQPLQVVGGRLSLRGSGVVGRLNAMVLASRFGTGAAPLRFGGKEGWTETVTYTLFDRKHLVTIGGLDERYLRNQDIDLIVRLKADGVRFRRVDTEAVYMAPQTFQGIWRRAFLNGCWNIWGQRLRRGGLSWWHYAPMAMVGVGAALVIASWQSTTAFLALAVLACVYGILALGSSFAVATSHRAPWAILILPFLFLMHHVVYGLGSWWALFHRTPGVDSTGSS